ncbi:uncharacterized protein Z520_11197 [Fonsecaea multimorphosa CBS 102226]|uniref:Uncharacterized protein n=1 Tax=Fonsecaea multimorphosa CBS 102226 TaxID=1442371 RepID=A0A0D2GUD7_9EURO|nr:uncharacterized protein Z520_11197 [Fonsecaea multimorphosa CBS 102226]KIX93140.1 hypothetical protein Z520_11197 [Fonsecaea multimorphosa CBS 102226]OAL18341.1 hypothetical protein AYO22_10757 [Fonsecaea multimorphosa]
MELLAGQLKGRRVPIEPKSEPSTVVSTYFEQYKTENIQTVFKEYYPSAHSSQQEKDLLVKKRLEISKAAERLDADKKSFSAANHQAAQEREEEGVRCYDWAYARQSCLQVPEEKT